MKKTILPLTAISLLFIATPGLAMDQLLEEEGVKKDSEASLVSRAKTGEIVARNELLRRDYIGLIPQLNPEDIDFLSWPNILENDNTAFFAVKYRLDIPHLLAAIKKRAEQGIPAAQNNLGLAYELRYGVEEKSDENDKNAVRWYTEAAEKGDPHAQNQLGLKYLKGRGVVGERSFDNNKFAFECFEKSAKQGYPYGQYNLASMYRKGNGVEMNPPEAFRWALTSKIVPAKRLIRWYFSDPYDFGDRKYSFYGMHYDGSFQNMLNHILQDEKPDKKCPNNKPFNLQKGGQGAPLMGLNSLVDTHQGKKNEKGSSEQLLKNYKKVEGIEKELLDLINSLKEKMTPGFMTTGLGNVRDDFRKSLKFQGDKPFLSEHSLADPRYPSLFSISISYLSMGNENVSLANRLVEYIKTIDDKYKEATEALEKISCYWVEYKKALKNEQEFDDVDSLHCAQQTSKCSAEAQGFKEKIDATIRERRSLEVVMKRVKDLPYYGAPTRNFDFFEAYPWLK